LFVLERSRKNPTTRRRSIEKT